MPTFTYKARDLQGVDHQGTIETVDVSQVARILTKKRLIVISVKEIKKNSNKNFISRFLERASFSDLVIATRQLSTMIESGMVVSEALDILEEQQSNKRLKEVLGEVARDIRGGLDLASSMKKHPDVFPALYVSLVRAGEQAGKLDVVLSQMANSLEKEREFRSKVRGAMIYPALVLLMMVAVIGIMMFFVVPRLTSLYDQSSIELPLPTKILIGSSDFLLSYWWMIAILLVVGIIVFRRWVKTPSGRYNFDALILKVPVVSKIVQETTLTSFTRTFGLLTSSGVPLLDALTIMVGVVNNMVYKKALESTVQGVERGLTFSSQLELTGVFPKIIPQMYKVGEETGKVDKVSFKMADYFEEESDQIIKNLTVIIEPVVLVVLGLMVAFIVLSIILPIYKLTTSFS